jgi:hypothetical protein
MRWKRKQGQDMGTVSRIQPHIDKKEKQGYPYSITDMIFDRDYRKKTYAHYNNKYQETEDEKEIFKAWTTRRKGKDN